MAFNTNEDPRSFMYYRGTYYINGTEIKLKEEYIKSHKFNGLRLWKYAKFHHQVNGSNGIGYFFCKARADRLSLQGAGLPIDATDDCAAYFVVPALELENAIEEVTSPIKLSQSEQDAVNKAIENMIDHPKGDWDDPALVLLWVLYIAVMIGSLIFKQFFLLWVVATIVFVKIREDIKRG